MTYQELLNHATNQVQGTNKEVEAVKLLLLELSKLSPAEFYLNIKEIVPKEIKDSYLEALEKYVSFHIPVQHLIGYSYFFGRKFIVNEHVLIPRPETELLVEQVLLYYDEYFNEEVQVLDLGTGSGCIATTLALEEKSMRVEAVDLSVEALKTAAKTASQLGSSVRFFQSDWFSNVTNRYDLIVANPPYIPSVEQVDEVVDKEPSLALYGGDTGLVYYEAILRDARKYLKAKSLVAFEHGYQQKEGIRKLIETYFPEAMIVTKKDLAGKDRMTFFGLGGVLK